MLFDTVKSIVADLSGLKRHRKVCSTGPMLTTIFLNFTFIIDSGTKGRRQVLALTVHFI